MKTRSEQGNKESRSLKIIEKDLVPSSPVGSPDLFKKQILLLNERQMLNEIMKEDREIQSISRIRKEDPERALDEISLLIIDLQKFFDTKRKLGEDQIYETSALILSEYSWLTLYEIAFCFKEGKLGKYGKVYDRLDGSIILEWLKAWDQRRTELVVSEQQRISDNYKGSRS